ncbi:YVTN repeat-like/Quino protein amine dehydrogenase [Athelia psychrophila]|uniref:YVTN repeat-like/Quino protein amine dehydrogenase n=1 Tax=Athelia psychrophila TaxID=1759441 RepID=A0A166EF20_9AGAM|nr:YVTN repeat-like/Quino protein amine dehydrogenase [Fibularhizoctonia sp. CBS 109695]
MATIRHLGSVLSYGPVVQVLHPSFLDFLSSRERCGRDIWCFEHGPLGGEGKVGPATLCLQRMNAGLEGNICDMTLSSRLTTEVLPEELAYACQFWVDYIFNDETFQLREIEPLMVVFFHTHLLHWFEAMSILKKSEEVAPMLQRAATWLEKNTFEDKSLKELVIEAIDFAHKFSAQIAEHPLYVYYVALPLCLSDSILYQLFHEALVPPHGPVRSRAETASLYLLIMNAGLKRNICNMTPSAHLTTEALPEELAYACQSWVDHIYTDVTFGSRAMEKLVVFLRAHLLHWFEAMSLLKKSEEIAPMLQRVATWLEENTFEDKSLKDLVIEAIDFARKFAAEIAEHPLYVYYTALPLLPSHSILYQLFHDSLADPSILLVAHAEGRTASMAFSTDGLRLVTGCDALTVWDTTTGDKLLTIETPGGTPWSAAFSYDGSRIAGGTDESTVYAWDSVSGAQVIGPLRHSKSSTDVMAVTWSTDGERLLSGCRTGEVILWNIMIPDGNRTITKIHHPDCSGEICLRSVTLSSDASRIASCSLQGNIHVWDSTTGAIVWSGQEGRHYEPWIRASFVSNDMGAFVVVKMSRCTQTRDASTGDLCPLPDSLVGAVGLARGDFMVNLVRKSIKKHRPEFSTYGHSGPWLAQGEYFAFKVSYGLPCHIVHLPKLLL